MVISHLAKRITQFKLLSYYFLCPEKFPSFISVIFRKLYRFQFFEHISEKNIVLKTNGDILIASMFLPVGY